MPDETTPPVNSAGEVEPPIPDSRASTHAGDELIDPLTGDLIGETA